MKIQKIISLLLLAGCFTVGAQTTNTPKDDVNARGLRGWTPLHFAALDGNYKAAETLLANNADVNARGDDGVTPLHLTTECQARWVDIAAAHTEVAKLLLDHQADVNAMDNKGQTPLHWVMTRECPAALEELLRQHGGLDQPPSYLSPYKHRSIQTAIQLGDLESIKELLKSYPDLITNSPGSLELAAENGNVAVAALLLASNADVNAHGTYGKTPLFVAVEWGKVDMVEFLLKNNADANATNEYSFTPLHTAAGSGNIEIAKLLLAHNAKVNAKADGNRSETPLHMALKAGHKEMAAYLSLHGGYDSPVFEYGPEE